MNLGGTSRARVALVFAAACLAACDGPAPAADAATDLGADGAAPDPDATADASTDAATRPPWSRVAAGAEHTCARMPDGTARCWGRAASGQLGDGTRADRATPAPVPGVAGVAQVVAGGSFACALLDDGTVRCWGVVAADASTPPGADAGADPTMASPVPGLTGVTQLAAGGSHVCALLAGGQVRCWGSNSFGQLGNGAMAGAPVLAPEPVMGLDAPVAEIAAGSSHSCARMADTTVRCWGGNFTGQLGDGNRGGRRPSAAPVRGLTGVAQIVVGDALGYGAAHSCARMMDGTVRCWGYNRYGQVGDGSVGSDRVLPRNVAGLTGVVEIAAGAFHNCALLADRSVRCWGSNWYGQLGDGTQAHRAMPTAVTGLAGVAHLAAGLKHSCAELADGALRCWGSGGRGQLGDGVTPYRAAPAPVMGVAGAAALSVGDAHACVRMGDGTARCWGASSDGALGDGTGLQRASAVAVAGLAGVTAIAAGGTHTCAVVAGAVHCWGSNVSYQLGDGTTMPRLAPGDAIPGLTGATQVGGGLDQSCALLMDRTVRCWGLGSSGFIPAPRPIPGLADAIQLSVGGGRQGCALRQGSVASCFSVDATMDVRPHPDTPMDAAQIARGNTVLCFRRASGVLQCSGENGNGQLGIGTTARTMTAAEVMGLATAVDVAVGGGHLCAALADGTVRCWGGNASGQLGDGTTMVRTLPVAVPGLSGVRQVGAGREHSCALLMDGTVRCWGYNEEGQLGDGTSACRATPFPVAL